MCNCSDRHARLRTQPRPLSPPSHTCSKSHTYVDSSIGYYNRSYKAGDDEADAEVGYEFDEAGRTKADRERRITGDALMRRLVA